MSRAQLIFRDHQVRQREQAEQLRRVLGQSCPIAPAKWSAAARLTAAPSRKSQSDAQTNYVVKRSSGDKTDVTAPSTPHLPSAES